MTCVFQINNYLAHTSNQHNLKLATYSHEIAQEAKRDSSSMKTIAVLTMTFLPATYIAVGFQVPSCCPGPHPSSKHR